MSIGGLRPLRLGRAASATTDALGPLADLVGVWVGNSGFELIAVPTGSATFRLIVRPYVEVLTFSTVGALVPDRGQDGDSFIAGLLYETRVADRQTGEPLHVENGMWLNLGAAQNQSIVRLGSIPHGNAFLASGSAACDRAPPNIPEISGAPDGQPPEAQFGYLDPYNVSVDGFSPKTPNQVLQQAAAKQKIEQTSTLSVSTETGGILNIPFVARNANATAFACTYWVETVSDDSGAEFQQLQYSQTTKLQFFQKAEAPPGTLITWPHVNVNTLLKQ
jgi:hypothetical protein